MKWSIITGAIYAAAFLSSKFVPSIAALFYVIGLFYLVSSISVLLYVVIRRPYSASPLLKGLPLIATFTLPAVALLIVSASASSSLPFSAQINAWRS